MHRRQMHADLVGAAGFQFRFQQAESAGDLDAPENGVGALAFVIHLNPAFAVLGEEFV